MQQAELDKAIISLGPELGPDVVTLRYSLDKDWTDDPAIYFRVVLSDQAGKRDRLRESARRVTSIIEQHLEPVEQWGLLYYFNFRSQSEQEALKDKDWE